jgi:3-dehydro-L-gulonate 2-dehydrogenase
LGLRGRGRGIHARRPGDRGTAGYPHRIARPAERLSALATILDLAACLLSGGSTTFEIGRRETELGVSQVFIAIDCGRFPEGSASPERAIEETIAALHAAHAVPGAEGVFYPGERTLRTRAENLEKGIPVDEGLWRQVCDM